MCRNPDCLLLVPEFVRSLTRLRDDALSGTFPVVYFSDNCLIIGEHGAPATKSIYGAPPHGGHHYNHPRHIANVEYRFGRGFWAVEALLLQLIPSFQIMPLSKVIDKTSMYGHGYFGPICRLNRPKRLQIKKRPSLAVSSVALSRPAWSVLPPCAIFPPPLFDFEPV